jgi:LmbE family N-acetylglucosaminyl deacetylase
MSRAVPILAASLAAALLVQGPIDAQVRPIYDRGAAGLTQRLERLRTTASVLHTAAHPDDEDSAFIARMARGDHARVAYLSLNRGEGGQNIIGTELFDALGVIRTEELLQARRLDGGEQFFTRTFDYGFSKTREEAAAKWSERDTLGDMVRVIRTFRPLVVYSRWQGTPADGHGQHQFAGYLSPLAFKAAGDPSQFPEQLNEGLRPWQAKKFYRGTGFRPDPANQPTVQVQTGAFDPVLGRSFGEISAEGRSQHKTQEMGTIEPRGPQTSGLRLVESVVANTGPPGTEQSIFDGIDVTVPGIAALAGLPAGTLREELAAIDAASRRSLADYQPLAPGRIIPALVDGLRATRAARAALRSGPAPDARAEADFLLAFKERDFVEAVALAAGVVVDPLADEDTVIQGGTFGVIVRMFAPQGAQVRVIDARVTAPAGWTVDAGVGAEPAGAGTPNPFAARETPTHAVRVRVTIPPDAPLTQPYFLQQRRQGDSYAWTNEAPRGLPFAPPLLEGHVSMEIGGVPITISRPVQYRFGDRVRGELRREVNVVPAVAVGLDSRLLIVPLGSTPNQQRLVVRATSFAPQPVNGTLQLRLPQGWTSAPLSVPFTLSARGDKTSASFVVTAPPSRTAGTQEIVASALVNGVSLSRDVQVIAYPHIQTHRVYTPAVATAQVMELALAPVRVGYIMGSGDQVPEALRRMGVDVTLIDDETLATGDLATFDTIVVGVRASEARPEFVANNSRLTQYMEQGGTLIVQYQQTDYVTRGLAPYPAQSPQNSRVTNEAAPVLMLEPEHQAFTFPNRITAADFTGWVQERNLYAFNTFDISRYTAMLQTADPGEPAQDGGQVYANVGKGRYVYTAYAWFRQLPAGVPGAYRQFANLISLSKAPRR